MQIYDNITQAVGRTPLVRINRVINADATVLAKVEGMNPMGSVKDRIGVAMIDAAEQAGEITPNKSVIIEPTSGNTGIGLAMVCASRGYRCILVMPDSMSIERRKVLRALGAELELTPAIEGMAGAVNHAYKLQKRMSNSYIPQQFCNPVNTRAHYDTTGPEIWEAAGGNVDVFIAGVGTGGTITGCGRYFKERNSDVQIIGIEPTESPVISQLLNDEELQPGLHQIQGIGAGFIPEILDLDLLDEVITIDTKQSCDFALRAARQEALFVGISSGSALAAADIVAKRPENKGKTIVTILPSFGERYLSTVLFKDLDID